MNLRFLLTLQQNHKAPLHLVSSLLMTCYTPVRAAPASERACILTVEK
jgi:hypothetical protein